MWALFVCVRNPGDFRKEVLPWSVWSRWHKFFENHHSRLPRGKRHPLPGMLTLVFLGLLARIREMAVLQRWAEAHWDQLREPLGFERDKPPHATTISRTLAGCSVAEFAQAFTIWTKKLPEESFTVAVDAKTSCQGLDSDGEPVQLVTALVSTTSSSSSFSGLSAERRPMSQGC